MNDLSIARSVDPERDKQIVDLVIVGKQHRRREPVPGSRGSGVSHAAGAGALYFR
jgi:hypothetical protein